MATIGLGCPRGQAVVDRPRLVDQRLGRVQPGPVPGLGPPEIKASPSACSARRGPRCRAVGLVEGDGPVDLLRRLRELPQFREGQSGQVAEGDGHVAVRRIRPLLLQLQRGTLNHFPPRENRFACSRTGRIGSAQTPWRPARPAPLRAPQRLRDRPERHDMRRQAAAGRPIRRVSRRFRTAGIVGRQQGGGGAGGDLRVRGVPAQHLGGQPVQGQPRLARLQQRPLPQGAQGRADARVIGEQRLRILGDVAFEPPPRGHRRGPR